jgi:hypothetical protein
MMTTGEATHFKAAIVKGPSMIGIDLSGMTVKKTFP